METIYRGYELKEVFKFTNGKSDWVITPPNEEYGKTLPECTLEEAKKFIDEKIENQ